MKSATKWRSSIPNLLQCLNVGTYEQTRCTLGTLGGGYLDLPKAEFTSEREQNAACENDANVRCRRVPEARQTAFGYVTNVRRTAECYPSTVGTLKGIRVQYVYVGSIRCLGERRTIYKFTHMNVRIVRVRVPM